MAKHLTARILRDLIRDVDDDVPILIGNFDHEYQHSTLLITTALLNDKGVFTEDPGDDPELEAIHGKRVLVLVIS